MWKVLVEEDSHVQPKQSIAILEAMKLEINVKVPDDVKGVKVEKLLVQPGETVKAGGRVALLRRVD